MARYNDDQDLNALLKQKGRQDDPMNRFTEKKKKSTVFFASSTLICEDSWRRKQHKLGGGANPIPI